MEILNTALNKFNVDENEYFEALENKELKKVNLIAQARERKNINNFQNQVYDYTQDKKNLRYMNHELQIISFFLSDKTRVIPYSDLIHKLTEFKKSSETNLSLIINDELHYYHLQIIKNTTDHSFKLILNDSIDDSFSSKKFQLDFIEYCEKNKINFNIDINSSRDKLVQKKFHECGPCSLYNANKKLFNEKFSLHHKNIKNDKESKQFFKNLYLIDCFLLHSSIIYESHKQQNQDKIKNAGYDEESFDVFYKEIIFDKISRSVKKISNKKLTKDQFDQYIDLFDEQVTQFMTIELDNLPQGQAPSGNQHLSSIQELNNQHFILF